MLMATTTTHNGDGVIFDDPRQMGLFGPVALNLPAGVPVRLNVRLENDADTDNPTDGDLCWTIHSFNRRHRNYKNPNEIFPPNAGLRKKLKAGTAFILSCYEHGGISWMLKDSPEWGSTPDKQWDGTSVAGIMLFEHCAREMGAKDYEGRQEDAKSALDEYNDWVNGRCFYYSIEDNSGKVDDSCGGFIGTKWFAESVAEVLAGVLEEYPTIERISVSGEAADLINHKDILPKGSKVVVVKAGSVDDEDED
jgi:hypothetical protein